MRARHGALRASAPSLAVEASPPALTAKEPKLLRMKLFSQSTSNTMTEN